MTPLLPQRLNPRVKPLLRRKLEVDPILLRIEEKTRRIDMNMGHAPPKVTLRGQLAALSNPYGIQKASTPSAAALSNPYGVQKASLVGLTGVTIRGSLSPRG